MNPEAAIVELVRLLRTRGASPGKDLREALGISQATFSRLVRDSAPDILALGRGRSTRYALPRTIAGVSREIPLFEVDENGQAHRTGLLVPLHGGAIWAERHGQGELFGGMPFFVEDMRPQGFLGRAFARSRPAPDLPERITDWNDDQVIRALTQRGEDTIGNIIIGEGAVRNFMVASAFEYRPIPLAYQGTLFDEMAQVATEGQPPGSSAGGERPKFMAYAETGKGPRQVLVKFSPPRSSEVGQRWSDLLVCESITVQVLSEAGVSSALSTIVQSAQRTHLVVDRFDRTGERGRRGVISLGAIDDYRFGNRDNYTSAAARLERAGMISMQDGETLRLIHCFGILIGNTDMHFGNISFYTLPRDRYALAPVYDMLPMLYSPVNDHVAAREFVPAELPIQAMSVWGQAFSLAGEFWRRVTDHPDVSAEFKVLIRGNEEKVRQLKGSSARAIRAK